MNKGRVAIVTGGVVALTHSLALSLGPDVRVNCISPGWIEELTTAGVCRLSFVLC